MAGMMDVSRKEAWLEEPGNGTDGHSRRRLEGKGSTPKAEDRTYHPSVQA